MSLLNKFKKKIKKEEIQKTDKEKPKEEEPLKEIVKKEGSKASKEQTIRAYQIIKAPHITEKATFLTDQNKYVFKVSLKANKIEVKKAIETLYGVKVKNVHMIHSAPKKRRLGQHEGWRGGLKKGFKKAVVSLKEGEKIEILPR